MRLNGIRIEFVEARVAWAGPLAFGLILLAFFFPPIILPLVCALGVLIVLLLTFPGSLAMYVRESQGTPSGLSPRSPPLA